MRPTIEAPGAELYECFTCGSRIEGPPESRVCGRCGGELRHLGRDRDL